jgi:O-antigen/teichoic acid export membrane protein
LIYKKNSNLKTLSIFAGGNFIAAVLSGISGLIYAQWLTPGDLGEFNKYGILTGYLSIGLIFVHGALPRQYPYLIGKGEHEEAYETAAAAKWWYVMFSWLGTLIFTVLVIYNMINRDYRAVFGWGAQIPAIWMGIYGLYLQTMFRNANDFKQLSYIQVFSSVIAFVLLIFVKIWSYPGFVIRSMVIGYSTVFATQKYVPTKIKSKFNLKRLKQLARISLPLSIPSYIDTYLLVSTTNYLIFKNLGEHVLGVYSMAIMIQGMAMILVRSIHQVYLTQITIKFGQTESIIECIKFAKKPTLISVAVSILFSLIFSMLIGPLMEFVTPNYIEAVPVLKILIWQIPLFASGLSLIILSSALWYKTLIATRILKTIVCIVFILILPSNIENIGWSIVLSDLVYFLSGYLVILYIIKQSKSEEFK